MFFFFFFFLMIRRPPRSTPLYSSAASDVYKRQGSTVLHRIVEVPVPAIVGQEVDFDETAPESSSLGVRQQCLWKESRLSIPDDQQVRVFACQVFNGVDTRLLKSYDLHGGAFCVIYREPVEG